MTTLEICDRLAEEYEIPTSELADLLGHSYDGFTETERELCPNEVEMSRRANNFDTKSLAAAMFYVSNEVKLYFHFDLDPVQVPFGD